MTCLKLYNWRG